MVSTPVAKGTNDVAKSPQTSTSIDAASHPQLTSTRVIALVNTLPEQDRSWPCLHPDMAATSSYSAPVAVPTSSSTPNSTFTFPPHYSFPPFFTLQPVASTRSSQLASWSTLIQSYCRHNRIFTLTLIDALNTPLFTNASLRRSLSLRDAKAILSYMASPEGGNRAEFITSGSKKSGKAGDDTEGAKVWVYWRRPEEWAAALEEWVERTAQKGTVLTLYEIVEGDASTKEEFYGMDLELLQKSLAVCVKRGKAQVFGSGGEGEGVKFF
ncbi:escrt-ii complex component protein [Curvularia clavata]|uniref:Vacuolar protein-sorting-associated protein 25 n=1 Tax=Curvularia clavata TaxID=95742 RepID=A0A9Q9DPG2_CURCL|nr:escrt-ii complex component protein [Curvularia clavata]